MTEPLRDEHSSTSSGSGSADDNDHADPEAPGPGMPPPTAVESLVNALLEAGPEVAEHVVKAAQELLLAVQVIVDAADRAVKEQQAVRADADDGGVEADADDDEAAVRHLDLAD